MTNVGASSWMNFVVSLTHYPIPSPNFSGFQRPSGSGNGAMPGMKSPTSQSADRRRSRQVQAASSRPDRTQVTNSNLQPEYGFGHDHEPDHVEPNQFVIFMVLNVIVFALGLVLYYTFFAPPR